MSPNGVLSINEARLCLTARSRLHLQLGDATAALKDAEDSLSDNPNYIKGLFAKAEALYFQSDFEFALLFFHRGHRLRPELGEFRLGISKSQEAIENAIGDPEVCLAIHCPAYFIAASYPWTTQNQPFCLLKHLGCASFILSLWGGIRRMLPLFYVFFPFNLV